MRLRPEACENTAQYQQDFTSYLWLLERRQTMVSGFSESPKVTRKVAPWKTKPNSSHRTYCSISPPPHHMLRTKKPSSSITRWESKG